MDLSLSHFVIIWQIQFHYRPKHLLIVKIMWTLDIKCQAFKLSTCCCCHISGLGNVYPLPWRLHFASCTMLANNLQRMQAICQTAELHSNAQLLRDTQAVALANGQLSSWLSIAIKVQFDEHLAKSKSDSHSVESWMSQAVSSSCQAETGAGSLVAAPQNLLCLELKIHWNTNKNNKLPLERRVSEAATTTTTRSRRLWVWVLVLWMNTHHIQKRVYAQGRGAGFYVLAYRCAISVSI